MALDLTGFIKGGHGKDLGYYINNGNDSSQIIVVGNGDGRFFFSPLCFDCGGGIYPGILIRTSGYRNMVL